MQSLAQTRPPVARLLGILAGFTPLHWAAAAGRPADVRRLLRLEGAGDALTLSTADATPLASSASKSAIGCGAGIVFSLQASLWQPAGGKQRARTTSPSSCNISDSPR